MVRINSANSAYEVLLDPNVGKVWINGPDGGAVGRFNARTGIDIHRTTQEQLAGLSQCLHCTHGKQTRQDWLVFLQKAYELWGIVIHVDAIAIKQ